MGGLLEALLGTEFHTFVENPSPPPPTSPPIRGNSEEGEDHQRKPAIERPIPEANGVAFVTLNPIQGSVGKRQRRFLVALDGSTACPRCGEKGYIPHHLSLIFWRNWTRDQLAALLCVMRPGERLAWLGHRLVRLEDANGCVRFMRERNGEWVDEQQ
jgi:hypothetical protein